MEQTITKDILREELFAGRRPATELLYNRYSGMLFSYILQFVPDRAEAGVLLAEVFSRLVPQLQEAFDSSLSLFCWLQVECRKIVLAYLKEKSDACRVGGNGHVKGGSNGHAGAGEGHVDSGNGKRKPGNGHAETGNGHAGAGEGQRGAQSIGGHSKTFYFSLLADASPEHQWVFREMFLYGRDKESLAAQSSKDLAYVSRLLRECLSIIRKKLG